MGPRRVRIDDLNLYSDCPRLKWFYDQTGRDKEDFIPPLARAMENMFGYLFTYVAKHGKYPDQKTIDRVWSPRLVFFDADQETATNTWLKLRKFWATELAEFTIAYAPYPIRHVADNIYLVSHIPAVVKRNRQTFLLYFKPWNKEDLINDLHIKFGLLKARQQWGIELATVYNIALGNNRLTQHHVYLNSDQEAEVFTHTLESLMKAAYYGPVYPRLRCDRRSCPHWEDCIIGEGV